MRAPSPHRAGLNAIPALGWFVGDWSAGATLLLYWLETLLASLLIGIRIFMTRDGRIFKTGPETVLNQHVAVANPACFNFHPNLAGARIPGRRAPPIQNFRPTYQSAPLSFSFSQSCFSFFR